jgi:hypothetical protein
LRIQGLEPIGKKKLGVLLEKFLQCCLDNVWGIDEPLKFRADAPDTASPTDFDRQAGIGEDRCEIAVLDNDVAGGSPGAGEVPELTLFVEEKDVFVKPAAKLSTFRLPRESTWLSQENANGHGSPTPLFGVIANFLSPP